MISPHFGCLSFCWHEWSLVHLLKFWWFLGGGFKYLLFYTPIPGEMVGNDPIWLIFFQLGWSHQLDDIFGSAFEPGMVCIFREPKWGTKLNPRILKITRQQCFFLLREFLKKCKVIPERSLEFWRGSISRYYVRFGCWIFGMRCLQKLGLLKLLGIVGKHYLLISVGEGILIYQDK